MDPDFKLYDSANRLVLVVEVKAVKNKSMDWAAELRRNLVAHGALPFADYFLLVLSDSTFLWKDTVQSVIIPPDYQGDTRRLLKPYLPAAYEDTGRLSESGLELAVYSWLCEIASRRTPAPKSVDEAELLEKSGLIKQIREGSLVYAES